MVSMLSSQISLVLVLIKLCVRPDATGVIEQVCAYCDLGEFTWSKLVLLGSLNTHLQLMWLIPCILIRSFSVFYLKKIDQGNMTY